ncbi:MAG: type I-G CRISPR-associated protein Cas8g2 [Terriglobales bacterium]
MAEAAIPVDLFNPGQVFACMGFLEAAEALLGGAEGGFEWDGGASRFLLRSGGDGSPFAAALDFLTHAEVRWLSPRAEVAERDGGKTVVRAGVSVSRDPRPKDLPGELLLGEVAVPFGFWADGSGRFNTPFKKSTNGASCHVRWENARRAVRELGEGAGLASDPLNASCRTESLFRLDPRGCVSPIGAGLSPDKLRKGGIAMRVGAYPACEAMAVIGLTNARPSVLARGKLLGYCVWSGPLPVALARAAVGARGGPWRWRAFVVEHEEVKSGGDRTITNVYEERGHER